jgi:hypothetical protein
MAKKSTSTAKKVARNVKRASLRTRPRLQLRA